MSKTELENPAEVVEETTPETETVNEKNTAEEILAEYTRPVKEPVVVNPLASKEKSEKKEIHKHTYVKQDNFKARCTECGKITFRSDLTNDWRKKLGFKAPFRVISFSSKVKLPTVIITKSKGQIFIARFNKKGEKVFLEGEKATAYLKSKFKLVLA